MTHTNQSLAAAKSSICRTKLGHRYPCLVAGFTAAVFSICHRPVCAATHNSKHDNIRFILAESPSGLPAAPDGPPEISRSNGEKSFESSYATDEEVFADFATWVKRYVRTNKARTNNTVASVDEQALEKEGVLLASRRRAALLDVIANEPARALELAIEPDVRSKLPPHVVAQLEIPISGYGDFTVMVYDQFAAGGGANSETSPGKNRIVRSATVAGKSYQASVYGRRTKMTSKNLIAISGIALDNRLAIAERPLRVLGKAELFTTKLPPGNPDKRCPVCGGDATAPEASGGVAAEIGGQLFYFDRMSHLRRLEDYIKQQEATVDPDANGLDWLQPKAKVSADK